MRDWSADFPILSVPENGRRLVYLDNAATTQRPRQVLEAMLRHEQEDNANPHRGVYALGQRATQAHEEARRTVAQFFRAEENEIVFTQNATEALNLIAYSYGLTFLKPGDEIVLPVSEHHSNLVPWQRAAKVTGAKLVYLYPGPDGRLAPQEWEGKITSRTKIVTLAQVSNVLGAENPVREIAAFAHRAGAVVIADCAQSAPHMPVDVKELGVDFAVCSAHKLYGPMGVGVLYGRKELLERMPPFLSGGDMIGSVHEQSVSYAEAPRRFEAGTRNVGGEVGFAAALAYIRSIGWPELMAREQALMERALEGMKQIPELTIYGPRNASERTGVIAFAINGVHPHDVATILDADGVAVRAGHHCAQPLMDFLGISACCRVSFAVYNTMEDVEIFLQSLQKVRRWMGYGTA